jgi:predicted pyridoxine 5'-phosphate oxidase superfamily flavin-nucleotide-binding protein
MQPPARDVASSDAEPTFHAGEAALQRELGVAERMQRIGPQVIRRQLPEQHRDFFRELPFIVVGSMDARAQPSASLLARAPGFVFSPDPGTLRIDALPLPDDPLSANLSAGAALGVLGILPHERRRNRVNGRLTELDARGFSLGVDQSFGNCPKYIWPREPVYVGAPRPPAARRSTSLGQRERALVACADTFYLASAHPEAGTSRTRSHGVDVSHRGGPPGFAHFTDDASFIVPDFRGNNFYNSLGNLQLNPRAGLLFLDFDQGDVLLLEATGEMSTGSHPLAGPYATGRILRFQIQLVRFFPGASPLHFRPVYADERG